MMRARTIELSSTGFDKKKKRKQNKTEKEPHVGKLMGLKLDGFRAMTP